MGCSSTNLYTRGLEGSFLELSQLLKPHEAPKGDTPVVPTKHNVPEMVMDSILLYLCGANEHLPAQI